MPEWYGKARKKLQDCIDDIVRENCIDWHFSHDSETLNDSMENIMQVLVRVDEQVKNPFNVSREEQEIMEKSIKKHEVKKRKK